VTDTAPGELQPGHIGVYTRRGERVGHVHGHKAGAAVARRMLGAPAVLSELHGKPAWIQRQDPTAIAAKQRDAKHTADLAAAKGSVGKPHAPKAHARPRRG
jgi:hypothetical protein